MKRLLFLYLLVFAIFPIYSQIPDNGYFTFQMIRKNSRFYGYYLPLEFIEDFEKSRDWFSSRKHIDESKYIYIRINERGIWLQEPIVNDGYSEELIDYRNGIENYKYEINRNNDIITIPALDFGKFRIETFGCFREYDTNLLIYGFNRGWQLDLNVEGDVITIYTYASWIFANRRGKNIYWTNKM